jgi:hypothetical protein
VASFEAAVEWGTLTDQEKFIQAAETSNLQILLSLVESNDTNRIEGDLSFFQSYAARFEEKKNKVIALNSMQKQTYSLKQGSPVDNSLEFDNYL